MPLLRSLNVDQFSRHATIDNKVRPRDEAGARGVEQEGDDFGDILRPAAPVTRATRRGDLAMAARSPSPDPSRWASDHKYLSSDSNKSFLRVGGIWIS